MYSAPQERSTKGLHHQQPIHLVAIKVILSALGVRASIPGQARPLLGSAPDWVCNTIATWYSAPEPNTINLM